DHREYGREARQEVCRAGGPEQAPRRPAAEGSADIGSLAVLQQHQHDDAQCREHMHDQNAIDQPVIHRSLSVTLSALLQIAMKSSATNEAPPIRPPSTSACANNSPALAGLTLPPYST